LIDGAYVLCPTREQLEGLTSNDYMLIRPPLSKADPFGHIWSSKATCIRFERDDLNAAWHVQQMELDNMTTTLQERRTTPLFCSERLANSPIKAREMRIMLDEVKKKVLGLTVDESSVYSWHSFRIYLACALMACKHSDSTIKAMLRWQSDELLRIYAHLNTAEYARLVQGALIAEVSSGQTQNWASLGDTTDASFYQDADVLATRLHSVTGVQ